MVEGLRLMAVHAHPDDESSKGAATTAKYVAAGASVMVVSCTGGERGDILNEKLKNDPHILRDIAQVRRDEMEAARAVLGCEHTWLGFVDSGLPEGDPLPPLPEGCFALEDLDVTTEALVRVIRSYRPHVMTTYDEKGGYPHPDHIMCHTVAMSAFEAAGDPERYPHAGEPWQPLKIYYNGGWSKDRLTAIHDAMLEGGLDSPYAEWLANWRPRRHGRVTTRIACSDYFETRDRALMAHATQVDPDGFWFQVPLAIQQRVWGVEEFEAAVSYVPIPEEEDDLFAGLGTLAEADALATTRGLEIAYDGRISPDAEPEQEEDGGDSSETHVEAHTVEAHTVEAHTGEAGDTVVSDSDDITSDDITSDETNGEH
ncbi:GlcNAc-PI de-N-acetylase [Intrasporangium oryzae NRRL B-24470]|uniref:Mycothiol S-conjugate amidase n=1 Tax=Intrasporangium oryzae NRRL B-24470 TaxID=1386089 RepID=W9G531_9MICO|nr:GlcNAc-PI de-N-acetylase [Intrasporangium oryzae NRRL B-24470]